jgi:hypothetical protein
MSLKSAAIWVGASALLMLIGAFGPWATVFSVLSVSGTDGDGKIVLIAALVIGAMVALRLNAKGRRWTVVVALLAGLIAAATSIYDMANIQNTISNSQYRGVISVGWGLWIDCIASVSAVFALVVLARAKRQGVVVPVATTADDTNLTQKQREEA